MQRADDTLPSRKSILMSPDSHASFIQDRKATKNQLQEEKTEKDLQNPRQAAIL